jgi:iron complex outermembrane receptor protein
MSKLNPNHRLKPSVINLSRALALLIVAAPSFAQTQAPVSLGTVNVVAHAPVTLAPTETAPSQGSLEAHSAQSIVSDKFIRDFTSPVADYTQALSMTPGVFSTSSNGVGLGDAKVTVRGLSDSNLVFSFDGIPFNDTNGVSHHSWVFFPSEFLGGAVVDRSPGGASTIGQATFGGSVDLKSRVLEAEPRTSVTLSTGSWNTNLIGVEHETGQIGVDGKSNLLFTVQEMKSDGYQTYNIQDRKAASAKYQTENAGGSTFTVFASYLNLKNNTPSIKGVARSLYDKGDYTTLLSGDITKPNYYGFNFYDISTDFVYAGISTMLSGGWKLEDKVYTYRYWNKQNYNNSATAINATSAVDKLNSYTTMGNVLRVSKDFDTGTLRTGLWLEKADSFRFQTPSDPRTWVDSTAPNFSETYTTTSMQPYLEYEYKVNEKLKVTPGVKYASYQQDFVHLQDNGKGVGPLGGVYNKTTGVITGGAPSLSNSITYTDVLPSLDVHYKIQPNWTLYGQYALGDQIPSTSVFDVLNAKVSPAPSPTKATTAQIGTVWNSGNLTLAADIYQTKLEGSYTALSPDSAGNVAYIPSGTQKNQGIEAEANFSLGNGFSLYLNATLGSLKYDSTGLWVAGAPADTESIAVNYQRNNWSVNLSANRVGQMYSDDSTGKNEAFVIDPVTVANLFANYTIKSPSSFAKQLKLQFGVNNLFDTHAIVGIASATAGSSSATPNKADLLTVTPGRSISLTATLDF